jgi:hypothetical protein
MIGTYFQRSVSECELASSLTGLACCSMADVCDTTCNQGAGNGTVIDDFLSELGIHGVDVTDSSPEFQETGTFDFIANEIANGRPMIVYYLGPNISHVVLITGYNSTLGTVHVLDPLFGVFDLDLQQLYSGPEGDDSWVESWVGLNPQPGCDE